MKTKSLALTSSLFLVLFFRPPDAHAATVILPVMADTFILSSAPDNNAGGNTLLNLGTDGQGGVRRGLLRFDVSAIPAGATVTSAVLRLTVVRIPVGGPANSNFELHRLLADWSGGTQAGNSGAPATEGEVTWNSRMHGTGGWTDPGAAGDAEATASASQFVNSISGVTYEWAGAGVTRDVQDWMNEPGSNPAGCFAPTTRIRAGPRVRLRRWRTATASALWKLVTPRARTCRRQSPSRIPPTERF